MRYLSIQSSLIISYIEHHSFCLHSAYTQNEKPLFTRLPAIFFLFKLNSHICPSSIFAGFYCSSDTKTKVLFYGIHMLFSDSITKRLPKQVLVTTRILRYHMVYINANPAPCHPGSVE